MIVIREPIRICTILGSCVCVCLYDPVRQIAAMNHFMLPANNKMDEIVLRYGDTSLRTMLAEMLKMGSEKPDIRASVLGGSSMFRQGSDRFNIGRNNLEAALDFLRENEIQIELIEGGGNKGRKIIFDTATGIINLKMIKNL
ncbi:MAG TPA: chemotaxis protein CheD [Bacteroidales bacterium]|jgi:chemotaxis protein CheD|nr:chemotaxis protein CheD [Bacteroidales bacterium]